MIRTIEDKLGLEFTVEVRKNWEILFTIIQSSMLDMTIQDQTAPERGLTIAHINTYDYEQQMSSFRDDSNR